MLRVLGYNYNNVLTFGDVIPYVQSSRYESSKLWESLADTGTYDNPLYAFQTCGHQFLVTEDFVLRHFTVFRYIWDVARYLIDGTAKKLISVRCTQGASADGRHIDIRKLVCDRCNRLRVLGNRSCVWVILHGYSVLLDCAMGETCGDDLGSPCVNTVIRYAVAITIAEVNSHLLRGNHCDIRFIGLCENFHYLVLLLYHPGILIIIVLIEHLFNRTRSFIA